MGVPKIEIVHRSASDICMINLSSRKIDIVKIGILQDSVGQKSLAKISPF